MKKRIIIFILIGLIGTVGVGNYCEGSEGYKQVLHKKQQLSLKECDSLLGEDEGTLIKRFGEGKKSVEVGEDTADQITTRVYSIPYYKGLVQLVATSVDGNVVQLLLYPDYQTYVNWYWRVSAQLGVPMEIFTDMSFGNEGLRASAWNLNRGTITLRSVYNAILIDISL